MRDTNDNLLGTYNWRSLNVGGLGYVTSITFPDDGSCMGCRTDVGGAYRRESGVSRWTQLISSDAIPSAVLAVPGVAGENQANGVWEIAIAPNDAAIWWMFFRGRALRSADRGVTWADTNLNGSTGLYMAPNGGAQRLVSSKAAVDPANAEIVYCGSQRDGLWRRISGSWQQVASVPTPNPASTSDGDKICIIAIDRTSSLVGSGATSRRSVVYVSSNGNGIYKSTDGGDTFALMTGHPGAGSAYSSWCMTIDQNGLLYVCLEDGANDNVWKWNGTSWSNITYPANIRFLAVDPKDALRLVGSVGGGQPLTSTDGGATWIGIYNPGDQTSIATNVPIVASVLETSFRASTGASAATFRPHPVEDKDYIGMGLGVMYFSSPWPPKSALSLVWVEDSEGIEELVAHNATITPNGDTLICSHDKAIIRVPWGGVYPEESYPPSALTNGYAVDWAIDDTNFLVCRVAKGQNYSGYSQDAGTTWTQFATSPTSSLGGTIAVSNKDQIVFVPGQNRYPRYSHDYGATWNLSNFVGVTLPSEGSGASGFGFGTTETRRHILCADKDAPGTFYIYSYGAIGVETDSRGLWKSTDGGANFTRVNSGYIIPSLYIGYHVVLKCVEGDLYITSGDTGSWYDDNGGATVLKSTDGGVNWTTIAGITEAMIAFGKAPYNSSYPTLYMIGWYGGVYGLHRSYDGGTTIESIDTYSRKDQPYALAADPSRFGRVIVGFSGTGFMERTYDYTMRLN